MTKDKSESKTKKRKVSEPPSKEAEFDKKDVKEEKDEGEPNHDDDIDPLAEGWEAAEILGATDVEGQVHFLIRWKGSKRADLIPSPTANVRWPQIVIKFYEDRNCALMQGNYKSVKKDLALEGMMTKPVILVCLLICLMAMVLVRESFGQDKYRNQGYEKREPQDSMEFVRSKA
ncbi:Heterochromatin protein 1 [Acropora cervicornis]|uniref:Heterochromatin protein 1 n=1 Tax=Acropora cervicornis TaxID=6130 RepID=A0AAD9V828_ACRCE|nr:Heterochromatin protein 1 [Acropora cervicornis]